MDSEVLLPTNFNNLILMDRFDEPLYKGDSLRFARNGPCKHCERNSKRAKPKTRSGLGIISYNETHAKGDFCRRNYHNLDRFVHMKIYRGAKSRKEIKIPIKNPG